MYGVCMLALTVAKTCSHYDRFAISFPAKSLLLFDLAQQDGNISGPKGPQGTRGNGAYPTAKNLVIRQNARYSANCACKIRQIQRDSLPKKNWQIVLYVRQLGFRQVVFRQIVPKP